MHAIDSIQLAPPQPVPAVAGVGHEGAHGASPHPQDRADISPEATALNREHERQGAEPPVAALPRAHPRHHPGPVAPGQGALREAQATLRAGLDPPVGNAREEEAEPG